LGGDDREASPGLARLGSFQCSVECEEVSLVRDVLNDVEGLAYALGVAHQQGEVFIDLTMMLTVVLGVPTHLADAVTHLQRRGGDALSSALRVSSMAASCSVAPSCWRWAVVES